MTVPKDRTKRVRYLELYLLHNTSDLKDFARTHDVSANTIGTYASHGDWKGLYSFVRKHAEHWKPSKDRHLADPTDIRQRNLHLLAGTVEKELTAKDRVAVERELKANALIKEESQHSPEEIRTIIVELARAQSRIDKQCICGGGGGH